MISIKPHYDVIVIGSGPAACACAIKCGKLELKTLCIDNLDSHLSQNITQGQISHPGCLETIILLNSANFYAELVKNSKNHGVSFKSINFDLKRMMTKKTNILKKITQHTVDQFNFYQIDFIHGKSRIISPGKIELSNLNDKRYVSASHIVLATESIPISVQGVSIDNQYIIDSTSALNINNTPKQLAILGAGVLGLELAGIWNRLGSETILFDAQESFLSLVDHQISREAYKIFTEQGIDIRLGTRILSTKIINNKVVIEYQDIEDGVQKIEVDMLLVASGKKPNSENLAAPEANLFIDSNGFVLTDENYRTNLPNVYAIGDLALAGPMLTHKGVAEGNYVAEFIANRQVAHINFKLIPNVIYTYPEIAWIGQTELTLNALGYATNVEILTFDQNIKALCINQTEGIIKIVSCAKSETILGIQLISNNASDLISFAALAMEFSSNIEDIKRTIYPYLSLTNLFATEPRNFH